mgnify:CR=1 FL=1
MRLRSPISTSSPFRTVSSVALVAALTVGAAPAAHAQDTAAPTDYGKWAAGIGVSSLGGELQVRYEIGDTVAVRGIVAGGAVNFTTFQDGFAYEYEVKLGSAGGVVDWHPFRNGFRLSAGGRYNNNHVDLLIRPGRDESVPSTILDPLNDVAIGLFSPALVEGQVEFFPVAPYFGIGYFGPIYKRLWLSIDAGLYYQGDPNVTLNQGEIDLFTQNQADLLASQEEQAERDLRLLAYYPVASFALTYRF